MRNFTECRNLRIAHYWVKWHNLKKNSRNKKDSNVNMIVVIINLNGKIIPKKYFFFMGYSCVIKR